MMDYEIINSKVAINFQNMPEDRLTTNLYHRLRTKSCFLGDSSTQPACQYDCFQTESVSSPSLAELFH